MTRIAIATIAAILALAAGITALADQPADTSSAQAILDRATATKSAAVVTKDDALAVFTAHRASAIEYHQRLAAALASERAAAAALDAQLDREDDARDDFDRALRELATARAAHNARRLAAINDRIATSPPAAAALLRRAALLISQANKFDADADHYRHSASLMVFQTWNLDHRSRIAEAHAARDRRALDNAETRTSVIKAHALRLRRLAAALAAP